MHSTLAKKVEAVRRRGSRSAPEAGRPVAARATSRFLPIIQAKLRIGAPNDKYEQEADRVANQVMSMPEPEPAMAGGLHRLDVAPQTTATDSRFPPPQTAALKNEPTAGFPTQGQPEVLAIARPTRQTEAAVIQRQDGGVESSVEQQCENGFGKYKVGDIYKLYATTPARPIELTFAMIGRRADPVVYSRFYYVGDWLADEWEIVEITNTHVTVINATCGTEEMLPLEAGEPRPQAIVAVAKSNFGPGIVSIYDNCKRVEFVSDDKSQPTRVYLLETWRKEGAAPLTVYLLKGGDGTPYPPPDLEMMLKVHLIGEKCGTPMSQQNPPSEEQVE